MITSFMYCLNNFLVRITRFMNLLSLGPTYEAWKVRNWYWRDYEDLGTSCNRIEVLGVLPLLDLLVMQTLPLLYSANLTIYLLGLFLTISWSSPIWYLSLILNGSKRYLSKPSFMAYLTMSTFMAKSKRVNPSNHMFSLMLSTRMFVFFQMVIHYFKVRQHLRLRKRV